MKIQDGTGSNYEAKVDSNKRLNTFSVSVDTQHDVNHNTGECYSIVVSKTPTGAADVFLYVKNTSEDDLVITSLKLYTASAESVQIKLGDTGTPVSGSTNAPVNRNTDSGKTFSGTVLDGVNITGLSGGAVVDEVFGSTTMNKWGWSSGLILPKNGILSLYAVTGGVALKCTLSCNFQSS